MTETTAPEKTEFERVLQLMRWGFDNVGSVIDDEAEREKYRATLQAWEAMEHVPNLTLGAELTRPPKGYNNFR